VRKSDLLAELTDVLSDGVSQDLWLLSVGIDNNPWGQHQRWREQLLLRRRNGSKGPVLDDDDVDGPVVFHQSSHTG